MFDIILKNPFFILETLAYTIFFLGFVIFFTFLKKREKRSLNLSIFYFAISSIFLFFLYSFLSELKYKNTFSWGRLRGGDLSFFLFTVIFFLFISLFFLSFYILSNSENKLVKKIAILLPSISFFFIGYKKFFLSKKLNALCILFSIALLFLTQLTVKKNIKKHMRYFILITLFFSISFIGLFEEVMKTSRDPISLSKKKIVTPSDCGCTNCHKTSFFKNFPLKDRGKFRVLMLSNKIEGMENLKIPPQVIDKLSITLIPEKREDKFFNTFFKKGCFNCHLPEHDKNKISVGGGFLDFRKIPEEKLEKFLRTKGNKCIKNYNLRGYEIKLLLKYIYSTKKN